MLSAPAHIPAIIVVSFGAGLADPDWIFGAWMALSSFRHPMINQFLGESRLSASAHAISEDLPRRISHCSHAGGAAN